MQQNIFVDNIIETPVINRISDTVNTRFTLISNEYGGRDKETSEVINKTVNIQFTAWEKRAAAIVNNIVEDFKFGAPGKERQEKLRDDK